MIKVGDCYKYYEALDRCQYQHQTRSFYFGWLLSQFPELDEKDCHFLLNRWMKGKQMEKKQELQKYTAIEVVTDSQKINGEQRYMWIILKYYNGTATQRGHGSEVSPEKAFKAARQYMRSEGFSKSPL